MLTEKKKTALIITLIAIALLINMTLLLSFVLDKDVSYSYNRFLYKIRIIFWGWFLAFGFAGAALAGVLYWKPGSPLLRAFIVLFSIIAIIFALLWLWGVIIISTLKF